jgi:hypothetical protein
MPIVGHRAHTFGGHGGDTGFNGSITVNLSAAYISAQAGYHIVSGGGLHAIGIKSYRHRPTVDGPEQTVDFGSWPNWRHTLGADRVTSVTFGIALGAHQEAHCYGNIFWWG